MLTRRESEPEVTYDVQVFLADRRHLSSMLRWSEEGQAVVAPALEDAWAQEETLKLARVLRKSPKQVLSRWRGRP